MSAVFVYGITGYSVSLHHHQQQQQHYNWPPSEVSSTLLVSWLLSTNSNILATFPTSSLRLARGLPTFLSPVSLYDIT
jgi:hypothetical protein